MMPEGTKVRRKPLAEAIAIFVGLILAEYLVVRIAGYKSWSDNTQTVVSWIILFVAIFLGQLIRKRLGIRVIAHGYDNG